VQLDLRLWSVLSVCAISPGIYPDLYIHLPLAKNSSNDETQSTSVIWVM
jgi:hypothetical protein